MVRSFRALIFTSALALSPILLPDQVLGQPAHQEQVTGKKVLDHSDYDLWNSIEDQALTPDGRWLAYRLAPGEGDGEMVLRRTDRDTRYTVSRVGRMELTGDGGFVVMIINPAHDTVQALRRAGTKRDDLPPDTLAILRIGEDPEGMVRLPRVSGFQVPEDAGGFVAFHQGLSQEEKDALKEAKEGASEEETGEEPEAEEEEAASGDEEEVEKPDRGEGERLVLRALESGEEWRFEDVTAFGFSADGAVLAFARATEDGDEDGVYVVDLSSGELHAAMTGIGRYQSVTLADEGGRVAFLSDAEDWDSENPAFSLYVAEDMGAAVTQLAGPGAAGLPSDWQVSEHGDLEFSRTGGRLFFGTAPPSLPEPDEDLLEDEKVVVDVWNWKDPYLQPMQLLQADDERNRSYRAVAHLNDGGRVVQLGTEKIPDVDVADEGEGDVAIGISDLPYRQLVSWDGRYNDAYFIDMETGEARLVAEGIRGFGGAGLSPAGRFAAYWDEANRAWMAISTENGAVVNLSAYVPHPTWDLLDDHPQPPPPESFIQWTEGDREVIVADAYDLWLVDPMEGEAVSLTEGVGRRDGLRFRYLRVDADERAVPRDEDILLQAFDPVTKASGIYRDRVSGDGEPRQLAFGDRAYGSVTRAEDADLYLVSWSTFQHFPDLYVTGSNFRDMRRMSDANPQQSQYSWGSAEVVEWTSADGTPLQGILYKPEGFDASRKYPMMVYFYERMSDGLHRYVAPSAGSSSINFSFYVSRGYLLFIPDIPYKIGWPGESSVNAVVPGVLELVSQGFVDEDNIGVQGHSWGGYQISYMITRTNIFAAAEAGAPVSNMTSAYGGIRWGSGMSRMFQYERTQSRIGGHLWEAQHRYISNSPLFQADKVETPLLMMHNDEDTAVPWEQGIEYFVALRRLEKPVWLLNYNGEPHGLRREANRKDWAVRMQQFFDHYLVDAPAPVWMEEGVPATLKGVDLGLDLVTDEQPPATEEGGGGSGR